MYRFHSIDPTVGYALDMTFEGMTGRVFQRPSVPVGGAPGLGAYSAKFR